VDRENILLKETHFVQIVPLGITVIEIGISSAKLVQLEPMLLKKPVHFAKGVLLVISQFKMDLDHALHAKKAHFPF
jgi:hypothetical protein